MLKPLAGFRSVVLLAAAWVMEKLQQAFAVWGPAIAEGGNTESYLLVTEALIY